MSKTSAPPSTSSQPRSVAAVADGTVFVVELGWGVEVFQGGKKVGELKTKYTPGSVAAVGGVVAVGGEVRSLSLLGLRASFAFRNVVTYIPAHRTTRRSIYTTGLGRS